MNIGDYKVQNVASNYGFQIDNVLLETKNLDIKDKSARTQFIEKKLKTYLKSLPLMGDLIILDFAYREDPMVFGSQKWGELVKSEIEKRLRSKEIKDSAKQYGYSSAKEYYEAKFEECCGERSPLD